MEENEKIQDAEKYLAKLKEDEDLDDFGYRELLAENDRQESIDTAGRRGKEVGREEVKRKGAIENAKVIAKILLETKMSILDIMQVTELTEEEIKQIQEESK